MTETGGYLRDNFNGVRVQCCDFMEWQPVQYYSRVIMNPPFSHGQDTGTEGGGTRRFCPWRPA
ncbi:TPA: hypothetical protein LTW52_005034 [Escherichia coli]|nr:hypothetical protein [Escherichia coli]